MAVAAVLPSVEANAQETIRELFEFIDKQGQGDYLGERVSQLQHSLQAATLAQQAGADEETVLGALLHDVGRFIPAADKMASMFAEDGTYVGKASHEILGERYLRQLGFSEKICQLVGAHVMAKRYLTAVDKGYYDGLSANSKTTLKYQGGIFTDEQVKAAQQDPWLENKLAVRRWDDLAKNPKLKTPELQSFAASATKSLIQSRSQIELHGRRYKVPTRPSVVVCVDGFDPEYLQQGISDGILPNFAKFTSNGFHVTAKSCMPSFTNPNNVSIITGRPPSYHGIAGNFFLDQKTGEEKMVLDDSLLIGSTILEKMSKFGVRIAAVTAKDKLRKILQHGLSKNAICFSAEKATSCNQAENGIADVEHWLGAKQPSQYSGELSMYVLDAGIRLLEEDRADLFYLTLSDYIQHKYAPGSKESNDFLSALDAKLGRLVELGALVAVTGDHGMSDKGNSDGSPNVLYLEDAIAEKWGSGRARVICPITDPFVRHHGALGSFVRVHLSKKDNLDDVLQYCKSLPGVEVALEGREAAEKYEMYPDREGDIVVIPSKNVVIGSRKDEHDLSNLGGRRLRSHGGLSEQDVPLILSEPAKKADLSKHWRNFDAFDLVLNY
ncbi:hypothetical protein M409DRAFT_68240 [Zasmidium cellare ATCC 36951]|uniref:HD domain-containing protein n=1 Tax=Zasmidium cellare ATCC 36951 TaxID=1080233 RepID=A0A6A6CB54_ZASCE|nr:uncharacterized protein M409DRAFT_68240 [Zasmidium cellare ATCC 36951]KAF2164023.1 hypothetical protein M409DRAFT_68240 [Zasmidium cellare ATCC 36951]